MKGYSIALIAELFGLIVTPAYAGLEWDAQRINHTAAITDTKAEAAFTFTNTGDQPVTITSVRTSCGCTTAALDKQVYAPGETGEVTALFAFGDRTGRQHKRITVRTSEPGEDDKPVVEDTPLYLRVTIPQPVKVRPRMVYWKPGEQHDPKSVRVTIHHDGPVSISNAQVDGVAVSAELKTVDEGKQYELVITPNPVGMTHTQTQPETQAADNLIEPGKSLLSVLPETQSVVSFRAEFAGDVTRTYTVMARVMPAPADGLGRHDPPTTPAALAAAPPADPNPQPVTAGTLGPPDAPEMSKPSEEAVSTE